MRPEQFGHYLLIEALGRGGMAEVFLAQSIASSGEQRLLAIKRLLQDCCEDSHNIALLADEARIAIELNHPNIVQVFDFGIIEAMYYIAMEYVDGVDLRTFVEVDEPGRPPMSVDIALRIAISILDGLHFAHTRTDENGQSLGIIHRDVTPHNVLISRNGLVKLTDFGVARARISNHISQVGDIRGKFSYMPPEQACGGELDHRVDIFATGAILYELLCGRQPFRSAGGIQQLVLLNREVVPPSEVVPTLPRSLDDITLKALHVDPEKRFNDAHEFAETLKEQLDVYYGRYTTRTMLKLADRVEGCLASLRRDRFTADPHAHVMRRKDFDLSMEHSLIVSAATSYSGHTAQRLQSRHQRATARTDVSESISGEIRDHDEKTRDVLTNYNPTEPLQTISSDSRSTAPRLFAIDAAPTELQLFPPTTTKEHAIHTLPTRAQLHHINRGDAKKHSANSRTHNWAFYALLAAAGLVGIIKVIDLIFR